LLIAIRGIKEKNAKDISSSQQVGLFCSVDIMCCLWVGGEFLCGKCIDFTLYSVES